MKYPEINDLLIEQKNIIHLMKEWSDNNLGGDKSGIGGYIIEMASTLVALESELLKIQYEEGE